MTFSDADYKKLVNRELLGQTLKHTRPFTINNNLEDIAHTRIGKIVYKKIHDKVMNENANQDKQYINITMTGIIQIPLRTLAIFSNGELRINTVKALIAAINNNYFRAIKYFFRKD